MNSDTNQPVETKDGTVEAANPKEDPQAVTPKLPRKRRIQYQPVNIPKSVYVKLKAAAQERGVSLGVMLNAALDLYIDAARYTPDLSLTVQAFEQKCRELAVLKGHLQGVISAVEHAPLPEDEENSADIFDAISE